MNGGMGASLGESLSPSGRLDLGDAASVCVPCAPSASEDPGDGAAELFGPDFDSAVEAKDGSIGFLPACWLTEGTPHEGG